MQELKVLTSGPLSSSAPDCLSSSLKEYRASHGAVVLGSQPAIPVEGRAGTSLLSDNFLERSFSTRCWTNGSMAGNPANASSVRSTRLSRQPATSKMMLVLVYSGCPRSCLMAHSDRGHPPPFPVPRPRCPGLP